ncbi:MAG: hypothetical protein MJ252_26670 [archaeon]|nr:hypothetical protein [archaeon]
MVKYINLIFSRGNFDSTPRYLCVSCYPGTTGRNGYCDFCFKCVENIRKGNEEGRRIEDIVQGDQDELNDLGFRNRVDGRHTRDHVYLCLVCSHEDYDYYHF